MLCFEARTLCRVLKHKHSEYYYDWDLVQNVEGKFCHFQLFYLHLNTFLASSCPPSNPVISSDLFRALWFELNISLEVATFQPRYPHQSWSDLNQRRHNLKHVLWGDQTSCRRSTKKDCELFRNRFIFSFAETSNLTRYLEIRPSKISSSATRPVYRFILLLALCSNRRRNHLAEVESFLLLKSAPWNFSGRVWRRRFDRQQRFLRANYREVWRKLQCLNCGSSGANSRRAQFESWIEVDEHGVQVNNQ